MTYTERQSCICTINTLRRLALNIHGVIDVVDDAFEPYKGIREVKSMKNLIEWLIRKIYHVKVSVEFKEKK